MPAMCSTFMQGERMTYKERFYPETKFGGFTDIHWNVAFFNRVNSLLSSSYTVLDVGCGRGAYVDDPVAIRRDPCILKGKVAKVIGIDVDAVAKNNACLDEFHLIEGDSWPIGESSIDLILCDCVLEHIENPDRFFFEACRVLKIGGYLCLRTPNRWSYVGLFATLIPNRHHSRVTSVVQDGRKGDDVFPTLYKCNSIVRIRKMMKKHGFDGVVYGYEPDPSYLSFSRFAYWVGVLHQRFALGFLRLSIFAFGKLEKKIV
jgi:SAM-dependent methyltransferase